jgi:broad specificity phosphatase PhoE
MAQIFLVRHGQASFGSENYDRLSDLGRQQARWLGEYFVARGVRFRRAVAGSLVRQQDTARELLGAMGEQDGALLTHAGLNEYDGETLYSAHTSGADQRAHQRADFKGYWRTFRAAMEAWAEDRLDGMPESWDAFGERMRAAVTVGIEGLGRDDAVLLVSSGGAIGRYISLVTGAPGRSAIEFNLQFRNTGFCELVSVGDSMRLISFNNLPHLELEARRHAVTFA